MRTTRGDTCLQVGRLENGRLRSLGIDGALGDDDRFHAFPGDSVGDVCGSTDANGNGFVNVINIDVSANAIPQTSPALKTCQPPLMWPTSMKTDGGPLLGSDQPTCPTGSARIVAAGLLGPDTVSVTYRTPNGRSGMQRTSGSDGAYLLVFTLNQHTCNLYSSAAGPCGSGESETGASPIATGPITSITYRDGHVCTVSAHSSCPAVGDAAPKSTPVTAAEVAAPVSVTLHRARFWCAAEHPSANAFGEIACDGDVPTGYTRF